jgi:hypothetical protein
VESSGRGSSTCAQQWRGGGAMVVIQERGACYFICGRARRLAPRHFVDTSAAWARHGGVRAWSTAATLMGGRPHGRLGMAKARTTRGARGVGRKAVQRLGVPRRADRQTKAGLGRHVWRRAGRPVWRPRRDTARVGARSGVPGAKCFGLALFH